MLRATGLIRSLIRKTSRHFTKLSCNSSSSQASETIQENMDFPFLEDSRSIATIRESKIFFIIRGLPGSGKSYLAKSIKDKYESTSQLLSADHYGIIPKVKEPVLKQYEKFDHRIEGYCKEGTNVIVIDDTNHDKERLDYLFDTADKYQYSVLIVEPKTEWKMDCKTLVEKSHWDPSVEVVEKMKLSFEEPLLPLYFGWFLSKDSSQELQLKRKHFLETLGKSSFFRKNVKQFLPVGANKEKLDLDKYFCRRPNILHCTTKFCDYGNAEGAEEYAASEAVNKFYSKAFRLTISALFVTSKTAGAQVELSSEQLELWPKEEEEEVAKSNESLSSGSRAHITLATAEGVQYVQTGLDLLRFVRMEEAGNKGDKMGEICEGTVHYFNEDMWMLYLTNKIHVNALFSGFYGKERQESNIEKSCFIF
ncbi:2',3'-cyclic-nucleotide 3'-phosphodiesterase isoform X1 [Latimeria chalumnae]|uniref:2',3'-cyclic-nucleotide 3'-phosphodiesterase n=2 Tax=Latimeria chalumnae TaxID=7897 RepID=H3AI61_LATCH|nr:PREDICTED: 2',3'-cyclic-nucleotide 3'-phosphodiesterase isoform X1 [Latimeria chalumnae]|eukprot:XP_006006438.1 PREDICTED: 2',3'-cyclic-nucleotide 3'-phosphodiesterase isoform X1 [Latimeria chalumnae]